MRIGTLRHLRPTGQCDRTLFGLVKGPVGLSGRSGGLLSLGWSARGRRPYGWGWRSNHLGRWALRLGLNDVHNDDVSLSVGFIQATPVFIPVQVNRQSIGRQRELGVDHLHVAYEDAGSSLRIELRFLRGGDLRRAFRTSAAVATKEIV